MRNKPRPDRLCTRKLRRILRRAFGAALIGAAMDMDRYVISAFDQKMVVGKVIGAAEVYVSDWGR